MRHLEARREEINDLNVFPVADGDTGDNMARTMEAVRLALDGLERDAGADPPRELIVRAVAEAALLGARGNSGVITSQIVRGAAEVLATPTGHLVDPELISEALASAARAARKAVAEPTEGTILTVIDEMARAASERLAGRAAVLGEGPTDAEQNALLAEMLAVVLEAGEEAVRRTPEQLQVLADAHTVDAGAHALVVLVRGVIAGLLGNEKGLPPLPHYPAARIHLDGGAQSRYRWCLNLVVRGDGLVPEIPGAVLGLGDSIEVVGDESMLRVHIHTDSPDEVEAVFEPLGEVHVDSMDDMQQQIRERAARARSGTSVVAVSNGDGFADLFAAYGARVVDGGAKLNPSTAEILSAIESELTTAAVVLPNSPNVVLAAEEAARASSKEVIVAGCLAPQAAAEALAVVDLEAGLEEVAEQVAGALAGVRVGGVAEAARDDADGRFHRGDAIGLVGEDVVAWGEPEGVLGRTLAALCAEAELVSVYAGTDPPLAEDEVARLAPEGVEIEVSPGGQSTHWWLLAAQ